jgi:predicted kinase
MNKPLLIIVTGRPASGKTTLAYLLSQKIKCPLLSRDHLKEGFLNTIGFPYKMDDNSVNQHIYKTFFELTEEFISKEISVIIEAAFQHKLWENKLTQLLNKATIKIIICKTSTEIANSRYMNRFLNDPGREKYHGDRSNYKTKNQADLFTENYQQLRMNMPSLEVETTNGYTPGVDRILSFIYQ